jgi:hypothetical protein
MWGALWQMVNTMISIIEVDNALKKLTRGSITPTFLTPNQSSFCADNFWHFFQQQRLSNLYQNMVLGTKVVTENMP